MSDYYFKYRTPRDILEKAKKEYDKMISGLMDTDKVFNFFVTAWAVKDGSITCFSRVVYH